jgi:prevent-host-death family protein
MKQIPAGEFEASCLAVMDDVQATGEPVIVTKRGVPVVKLVPIRRQDEIFGFMAAEVRITGDIESPAVPLDQWEVLRDTNRARESKRLLPRDRVGNKGKK